MSDLIQLECSHAYCGETCDFKPPTIGPLLPRQVRDVDGELWTRHAHLDESTLFYWQRGKDVRIAFWRDIAGPRYDGDLESLRSKFPEGPWTVVLDGAWDRVENHVVETTSL